MTYPLPLVQPVPPDAMPTTGRFPRHAMRWQVIAQLVTEHGWTHGVEIGTADGRCTDFVLSACPKLHMSTVDLWEPQPGVVGPEDWSNWPHAEHEHKARTRLTRFGPRCRILKMCSRRAAALMPDKFFNFVFLDGDHGESGLRADIAAWLPKVRAGGMLLLHDINWPGARAMADALLPAYWIGPNNVAGFSVPYGPHGASVL